MSITKFNIDRIVLFRFGSYFVDQEFDSDATKEGTNSRPFPLGFSQIGMKAAHFACVRR